MLIIGCYLAKLNQKFTNSIIKLAKSVLKGTISAVFVFKGDKKRAN